MSAAAVLNAEATAYLASTRAPVRLACHSSDQWPVLLSLWFLVEDGKLWCATPARARVAQMLARDARCGFEISENAAPYRGVRGRGRATLDESRGKEVLRALVRRYLEDDDTPFARWLLSRREPEVAIGIEIERVTAWDFSARMGGTRPSGRKT